MTRRRISFLLCVAVGLTVSSACGSNAANPTGASSSTAVATTATTTTTVVFSQLDVVGTWNEVRAQQGPGAPFVVTFSSDGIVRGHDRCNAFFTHWTLAAGAISLELPVYNTSGCPEYPDIANPLQPIRFDTQANGLIWSTREGPILLRRAEHA